MRRTTQERLTALLEERRQAEEELSDAAGKRESSVSALYRLQGVAERIALRREAAGGLESRLLEELAEHERAGRLAGDETVRALEAEAAGVAVAAREATQASGIAAERARLAHARLAAAERRAAETAESGLDEVRRRREAVEAELADATGRRDGAGAGLPELAGARERLTLRRESVGALGASLAADVLEARSLESRGGPSPAELEQTGERGCHRGAGGRQRA